MLTPRHRTTSSSEPTPPDSPRRPGGVVVLLVSMLAAVSLVLTGQPAGALANADRGRASTVAQTDQGRMTSRIVGKTSSGQPVTGTFTPLRVAKKHGHVVMKGLVQGVVHEASGRSTTFTAVRSVPLKSLDGQHLGRTTDGFSGRASCDILHLVLGPLDLDLLGLQVHLNRVLLDVVAATGAGNLLGNLLCAITGLLDGTPAGGLLSQLTDLLGQILAALRLGA